MKITEDSPTTKMDLSTISAIEQSLLFDFLTAETDVKDNHVPVEPPSLSDNTSLPIEMTATPTDVCESDVTSTVPLASPITLKIELLPPADRDGDSNTKLCISATISSMSQISSIVPGIACFLLCYT